MGEDYVAVLLRYGSVRNVEGTRGKQKWKGGEIGKVTNGISALELSKEHARVRGGDAEGFVE